MNEERTTQTAAPTGAGKRSGKRYSAQARARLIRKYEASGMTGKAFSEQHGISTKTFYGWLKRARTNRQRFAEVQPPAPQSTSDIEIRLANGVLVSVPARGTAASVAALVRGICGC
jgi:transposase-like protein